MAIFSSEAGSASSPRVLLLHLLEKKTLTISWTRRPSQCLSMGHMFFPPTNCQRQSTERNTKH